MKKSKETIAAALSFDPEKDSAPVLKAAGQGYVAKKIIETAKEHGVPTVENENAAKMLNAMNIGDTIPRELYDVVAQILVFIAKIDNKK